MIREEDLRVLKEKVEEANSICILSHINPDGDSLGSSIALKLMLEKMGKEVAVFNEDEIHPNFSFLDTNGNINVSPQTKFDLCIVLDVGDLNRVAKGDIYFNNCKYSINVDHHADSTGFCNLNIISPEHSSVCCLLADMFERLNFELDHKIASALYTGISTDTGCFFHDNTDEKTHYFAGKMIGAGADAFNINYIMFSKKTKKQVELFAKILPKLIFDYNNQSVIMCLTQKLFQETGTSPEDAIGFVSYLNSIDCVKIAVVMQERQPNVFFCSIRARDLSAQNVAKYFGGGGHPKASGCRIYRGKNNAINMMKEAIRKELVRSGNWNE